MLLLVTLVWVLVVTARRIIQKSLKIKGFVLQMQYKTLIIGIEKERFRAWNN